MEIRLLHYFYAITKAGTFSKAAEDLFITQSALSQAIKNLEFSLKCCLFARGRKISLTHEGERLRIHCERIFHLIEDARDDLSKISSGLKGIIRPAILESILLFLLPEMISKFAREFPNVQFRFSLKETKDIETSVLENETHFGLVSRSPVSKKLEEKFLASYPNVLVCPVKRKEKIESLMEELPLFVLGDWQLDSLKAKTDLFIKFPKIKILNPVNQVALLKILVEKGLALAVLPKFVLGPNLRVLQTFHDFQMSIIMIRNPARNSFTAVETFMDFLNDQFLEEKCMKFLGKIKNTENR
ncbi:MAG: LysR family transcriptional regulator [Candidatus Riflebacteria bacterium]|nr:LysR family transcriptional regulator [Candidatus Riflebacteria bacterium]